MSGKRDHAIDRMIKRALLILLATLAATFIGLAGGLLYGLVVRPVEIVDVDPIDLSQDIKRDYVRLIAAAYVQDGDLATARLRLGSLGYGGAEVEREARQAIIDSAPSAPALARLSLDLGYGEPAFELVLATPTPSPTRTPTPTLTGTPTRTATATATEEPTATPSPSPIIEPSATMTPRPTTPPRVAASPTLVPPIVPTVQSEPPTATPAPQSATDFRIVERYMNPKSLNGGPEGCGLNILFLTVLDVAGNPLDGIPIEVSWAGGSEQVVSGFKAPGKVEFTMRGGYTVRVARIGPDGDGFTSESTYVDNEFPPSEDMREAGYCPTIEECDRMKATGQWCRWHHSYYVTFQRSW